jgi:hypothetical protein
MKVVLKYNVLGKPVTEKKTRSHMRSGWHIGNLEAVIKVMRNSDRLEFSVYPHCELDVDLIKSAAKALRDFPEP